MKKINTLLIGAGRHAKRIYLPYLKESKLCKLVACLELFSEKEKVEDLLQIEMGVSIPCYFTNNYSISDRLDTTELSQLKKVVKKYKIEAVIISTEPLAHFKYTKWALNNNLHILLDKPITTEIDASTDITKAKKIFEDYKKLLKLYLDKNKKTNLAFSLQAQRRFHVAFQAARQKIKEITKISHCPVTFIHTFHSDGQWTLPNEFVNQNYHPYNQGYGKMSHSGYHSLDIAIWLALASLQNNKLWDNFSLYSQFIRPKDITTQFSEEDYFHIFPEMKKINWNLNIKKANKITGEVDALTTFSLRKGKNIITSICCNTLHNSFSRRGWFDSTGKDLYKGNGRIRQESYIIEQGPFQSIIINSFQSEEIQKGNLHPYSVGGEYHFDIHIFRNKSIFPSFMSYEFLNIHSLKPVKDYGYSRGHQEDARRSCITDFYKSIINQTPPEKQISNIIHHSLTTQILGSIYVSAAKKFTGHNGLVQEKIEFKNRIYV